MPSLESLPKFVGSRPIFSRCPECTDIDFNGELKTRGTPFSGSLRLLTSNCGYALLPRSTCLKNGLRGKLAENRTKSYDYGEQENLSYIATGDHERFT